MRQQTKRLTIITILCVALLLVCFATACQVKDQEKVTPTKDATPEATSTSTPEAPAATPEETSNDVEAVKSTVEVHEGAYSDEKAFGFEGIAVYLEVEVSNIQDTGFDFKVYKVDSNNDTREVVLQKNTAVFVDGGDKAVLKSDDLDIAFAFPNDRNALPVVIDMKITGYEPLEGSTFSNNSIPGHEFG